MIITLTSKDRKKYSSAFEAMFRARASVFHDRLGWEVKVKDGLEIDRYDRRCNPIYLVVQESDGQFTGSLRMLSTAGEFMLRNEFRSMFEYGVDVSSPTTWECTRFCLHPMNGVSSNRFAAAELLTGLCRVALAAGIENIVAVYGAEMGSVYKRIGWSPKPLFRSKPEAGNLFAGLWEVNQTVLGELESKLSWRRKVSQPQYASTNSLMAQ